MYIIDHFNAETPRGKSMWRKEMSFVHFFLLDQIPRIKICHTVESENTEVIEGRRRLISMDDLDSDEAYEDGSIDDDGDCF